MQLENLKLVHRTDFSSVLLLFFLKSKDFCQKKQNVWKQRMYNIRNMSMQPLHFPAMVTSILCTYAEVKKVKSNVPTKFHKPSLCLLLIC